MPLLISTGKYVRIDKSCTRPAEVDTLLWDSSKARALLGWKPTLWFQELVRVMVEADLKAEGLEPQEVMSRAHGGPAAVSR